MNANELAQEIVEHTKYILRNDVDTISKATNDVYLKMVKLYGKYGINDLQNDVMQQVHASICIESFDALRKYVSYGCNIMSAHDAYTIVYNEVSKIIAPVAHGAIMIQ